jgi:hypothetical protein
VLVFTPLSSSYFRKTYQGVQYVVLFEMEKLLKSFRLLREVCSVKLLGYVRRFECFKRLLRLEQLLLFVPLILLFVGPYFVCLH